MRKLFFLILLYPTILLFSQTENIVIQWDKEGARQFFPHALYEDGENTLPYLSRKIAWPARGMLPLVSLEVISSTQLSAESLEGINDSQLEEDPLLEYSLVREAGTSFLLVKVLPYTRQAGGSIERVDRFEIHLEAEPALAPLRSESTGSWSGHSLLASGNWFRISVEKSGIHKLTFEQLSAIGLQNPATVRIFGCGASPLPEKFSEGYTDDLDPLPIYLYKGSDGIFGPGDHMLFYAQGPVSWTYDESWGMYRHHLHPYARKGYYFLTDGQGSADFPEEVELSTSPLTHTVTSYDYRDYMEEETYNLIHSGREWYGDLFSVNLSGNYPFEVPGLIQEEELRLSVRAAARSGTSSTFSISANSDLLGTIATSGTDLSLYTATYAYENTKQFSYLSSQDQVTLTLTYNRPDANSEGWLNSLTLNARSVLSLTANELKFRDSRSVSPGNISEFRLGNADGQTLIWEVTDPGNPGNVPFTLSGSEARFTIETHEHREFVAFRTQGDYPVPGFSGEGEGRVENQDLHGLDHPEMLIVTTEALLEEARRLADFRRQNDGLEVAVVLQQEVFNEFSSGTPDVSALRNFMKMFYDRSGGSGSSCRYLLLMGDGSYDNLGGENLTHNTNLILTYQSEESLSPTRSYVSDDFFGLLDTDESMYDGLLDIGIGRLPVSSPEEAADLVDKIIAYSDPDKQGEWRNQICFIGDDEDNNIHMQQADELARYVEDSHPAYNINKIYLDAYPQENLATGPYYPDVNRAFNDQVNRGALIINYSGHGGTQGLAHEKIITINDILSWTNKDRLPLFMTATCEFSRFDEYNRNEDLEVTSAGEEVLLSTTGGGIGLFTTTRLVYSGPNHALNERFYEVVFGKDAEQQNYRLGDIILYSKNNTGAGINKRNFTLLGDPSLTLSYPRMRVVTDSINGVPASGDLDSISAFQWVSVSGHIENEGGTVMDNFSGMVNPKVFDKEKKVETLSNDGYPVFNYHARTNILYSGEATVENGRFSFGFFVPKDINYAYGPGKISYYSSNAESDAHGSFENFLVGGIGNDNATDDEYPQVDLFMNDSFFVSGGITDGSPVLLAYVSDNYGINTTGNGIGHDLMAVLDEDRVSAVILNEFYLANTNSFNSGVIRYPFSHLEAGAHQVSVKIWDIHNNSSEATLDFVVMDSEEMLMDQISNYPNPFFDRTWFSISHNRPDQELRLVLTIHDLSGALVRIIDTRIYSPGYRLDPLEWDGTSSGGSKMGGGVYVYKATLSTDEGEVASSSGKLIITR
jgi:hypothetical protein